MFDRKVVLRETQVWKNKKYETEYVDSVSFEDISPITQVQAICFDEQGGFIVYEDVEGGFGLPGGTVEEGETLLGALEREVAEEVACNIVSCKPILYLRNINPPEDPVRVTYQVRYAAIVLPFSNHVSDPAYKAVRRVRLSNEKDLARLLGWGAKLDLYIKKAREAYV